ncbi:MAG: DNA-processing protein DprA [Acidobacteriota bacterium]
MDDRDLCWLALALLFYGPRAATRRLLARFPAITDVFRAGPGDLEGLRLDARTVEAIAGGRALDRARREVEIIERKAYTLLTLDHPGYPGYLREIFDPPFALYCEGDPGALGNPAVAVVGARRPTPYGRAVAEKLAADLAGRGCVVVSGLAAGIDACAHRGALKKGRTIAVLGSGLDVPYPWENRGLHREIAGRGAVVSELPLGTPPLAENFPVRNRIISGLALGLVVVEAARKSGSLISAKLALSQDREVMAVPGNVTSPLSEGPIGLIRDGARPVASWEDVADALPSPWRENLLAQRDAKEENSAASLSPDERRLLDELPVDAALSIDELAERTGRSVSGLLALLLGLELKGAVIQHPGKEFQRRM